MSVLERIVEDTRDEIDRRRSATPLATLEAALDDGRAAAVLERLVALTGELGGGR